MYFAFTRSVYLLMPFL